MGNEIITTTQMYWLTRLTPLGRGVGFIIFLLALLTLGLLILGLVLQDPREVSDEGRRLGIKLVKASPIVAVLAVILLIVKCLLPTTKEMAAILIIPRVANSEKVQTVGNHLYDLACEWMEEQLPAKGKEGAREMSGRVELTPCKECGHSALLRQDDIGWYVRCEVDSCDNCTEYFDTPEEASRAWNQRQEGGDK